MANTDTHTSAQYDTSYPNGTYPYYGDRVITDTLTLLMQPGGGGGVTLPADGQMYPLGYESNE